MIHNERRPAVGPTFGRFVFSPNRELARLLHLQATAVNLEQVMLELMEMKL